MALWAEQVGSRTQALGRQGQKEKRTWDPDEVPAACGTPTCARALAPPTLRCQWKGHRHSHPLGWLWEINRYHVKNLAAGWHINVISFY